MWQEDFWFEHLSHNDLADWMAQQQRFGWSFAK
jgi:hypothetical protein